MKDTYAIFSIQYEGDKLQCFRFVFKGPSQHVLEYVFCYCTGFTAPQDLLVLAQ